MAEKSEWQFLVDYVKDDTTDFYNEACRSQLMALWTAYCMHNDLDVDTAMYDAVLKDLFNALSDEQKAELHCVRLPEFDSMRWPSGLSERRFKMNDIRLVNVVPIVNGWNDAAKKNLEEAKTLMASGNHLDYNAGVVKESVANLVSGFADDLMKAPAVELVSMRPVGHWVRRKDRYDAAWDCSVCGKTVGPVIVLCSKYCLNCGAKMEENNA